MPRTSNDYCVAVKQKYEAEKHKKYEGFLFDPTPAKLRDLSLILLEIGLKRKDKEVFVSFFKSVDEDGLKKAIEKVDIERLRTVCNFLKGNSKNTNSNVLNLIAVLVDFPLRPYSVFFQNEEELSIIPPMNDNLEEFEKRNSNEKEKVENESKRPSPVLFVDIDDNDGSNNLSIENRTEKTSWRKKFGIGIASLLTLTAGYTIKNLVFPEKQCMKWMEDHYELVDCIKETKDIVSYEIIKPYDKIEFERKELTVCDTTEFFVGDKAKVWYSKKNNVVQFFNMYGENPENKVYLKPITQHMIDNYVGPCK